MTKEQIETWFTYHPPGPGDQERYEAIRAAAKTLALVIMEHTPSSADQTAAVRKLREVVMTANAAIACRDPAATEGPPQEGRQRPPPIPKPSDGCIREASSSSWWDRLVSG